jgi:hypothetical protein
MTHGSGPEAKSGLVKVVVSAGGGGVTVVGMSFLEHARNVKKNIPNRKFLLNHM